MRTTISTFAGALTAAALVGACLVGAPQPALAAPSTPPPTAAPTTSPSPTAAPSPSATPPAAPTAPTTADGSFVDLDPSLAEMNAAENHTMGSTVPSNEPQPAAPRSQQRQLSAQAAFPPGVPGLDVSGWQENVDWNGVWAQGARFAYVKATEGLTYRNGQFPQQYNGSYAVGMIRGAYHFARPNISSATAQANYFVANGGGWVGDSRTLPPLLDIEYNPYAASDGTNSCYGLSPAAMSQWIAEFSQRIQTLTGARPAIYTTTDWWRTCTGNNPTFGANPLFIARYPANLASGAGTLPAGWSSYTMWQYSSTGPFPGDSNTFNGSLATLQQLALNGLPMQQPAVGAGDLNGDGRPDVMARRPDGTLWFYPGAGKSGSGVAFGSGVQMGSGWGVFNQIAGVGDVTGDGKADVMARKPDGSLWLYAGTGASSTAGAGLSAGRQVGSGWDAFTDFVATGDSDGDGKRDLLARHPDGSLILYPGRGDGTLSAGVLVGTGWNGFSQVVGVGDVNGDGLDDLAGFRTNGSLTLYTRSGGSYASAAVLGTGLVGSELLLAAGDADGDGRSDLYARTRSGELLFLAGITGQEAAFGNGQQVGSGWNGFASFFGAGDLNGDRAADVVAIAKDGGLWYYAGYGTNAGVHLSYRPGQRIGEGWGSFRKVVDGGDVDGDGRRDLVGIRNDGSLWMYPGTGTVSTNGVAYGQPVQLEATGWSGVSDLALGDFDGDKKVDVVSVGAGGAVTGRQGLARTTAGSPWFGAATSLSKASVPGFAPKSTGDLNGDGKADLTALVGGGGLVVLPGTGSAVGDAGFAAPLTVGSGWTVFDVVTGTGDAGVRSGDLLGRRADGTLWWYPGTTRAGLTRSGWAAGVPVGSGWNIFG